MSESSLAGFFASADALERAAAAAFAGASTPESLEEARIEMMTYDSQFKQYRVRVGSDVDEKQREVLLRLVGQAAKGFGKG